MDEYYVMPFHVETITSKKPPLSPEYLKLKSERDLLLNKTRKELQERGYRIFKLTRSYFNYIALKSGSLLLIKVYNPLSNEKVSEKNLQKFADRYGIDVIFISKNGSQKLFQSKFRKYLTLKCYECGTRSRIYLTENIKCKSCGKEYVFKCWYCGHEFEVKEAAYCNRCSRFICPKCSSCGCHERNLLLEWKKSKHVCSFNVKHLMSHAWIEDAKNRRIIKTRYGYLVEWR